MSLPSPLESPGFSRGEDVNAALIRSVRSGAALSVFPLRTEMEEITAAAVLLSAQRHLMDQRRGSLGPSGASWDDAAATVLRDNPDLAPIWSGGRISLSIRELAELARAAVREVVALERLNLDNFAHETWLTGALERAAGVVALRSRQTV
ncbi:hypothetical protein FB459_1996 [Yimella lutea]|uniref:Uncharacterized protein n=1 Tax=Yimella lutea TaxID=587872 RepID=A0A542EGT1_9MICO|nr:hypothetical protein [Yimella lutea]TQJ14529.1 hypothetical protein FB459_1996 [Yimella lutea]